MKEETSSRGKTIAIIVLSVLAATLIGVLIFQQIKLNVISIQLENETSLRTEYEEFQLAKIEQEHKIDRMVEKMGDRDDTHSYNTCKNNVERYGEIALETDNFQKMTIQHYQEVDMLKNNVSCGSELDDLIELQEETTNAGKLAITEYYDFCYGYHEANYDGTVEQWREEYVKPYFDSLEDYTDLLDEYYEGEEEMEKACLARIVQ